MPAVLNQITFRSKHSNLRIVRRSAQQMMNPTMGTVSTTVPEVVYEFVNGVLDLNPGFDKMADKFNPETNEWEDRDAIEYMRTHELHGIRFFEIEPVAPDPSVALAAIADAVIAGDLLRLEQIGDEEFGSFNRPQIMERVRAAMDSLEATEPPPKVKE